MAAAPHPPPSFTYGTLLSVLGATSNTLVNVQSHEHITPRSPPQSCAELITFIAMVTTISAQRLALSVYGIMPPNPIVSCFFFHLNFYYYTAEACVHSDG